MFEQPGVICTNETERNQYLDTTKQSVLFKHFQYQYFIVIERCSKRSLNILIAIILIGDIR